jgi:catechol 2,3-dioxygenase-like lactoylglutathione lyase family enzyme
MTTPKKRLGELVLRSENAERLVDFYTNVINLEVYAAFGSVTFLKIDDDYEGHPQLLAIFQETHTFSGPKDLNTDTASSKLGTLHHFAFVIDQQGFELEKERLTGEGLDLWFTEHTQFGWRSMYLFDPDGNSVEYVCYDQAVLEKSTRQ